jgi:hypothetical protein
MSSAVITLACIVLLPIAIIVALRVNATLVFLSLCLGDVLAQFVANNTNDSLSGLLSSSHITASIHPTDNTWRILLLLLPVVITTAMMIHTVKGNSRILLNILPAAGVGLVGALLVVPLMPASAAQDIINSTLWTRITDAQSLVVGISAIACLGVLWLQRPKVGGGKHGKHSS